MEVIVKHQKGMEMKKMNYLEQPPSVNRLKVQYYTVLHLHQEDIINENRYETQGVHSHQEDIINENRYETQGDHSVNRVRNIFCNN